MMLIIIAFWLLFCWLGLKVKPKTFLTSMNELIIIFLYILNNLNIFNWQVEVKSWWSSSIEVESYAALNQRQLEFGRQNSRMPSFRGHRYRRDFYEEWKTGFQCQGGAVFVESRLIWYSGNLHGSIQNPVFWKLYSDLIFHFYLIILLIRYLYYLY